MNLLCLSDFNQGDISAKAGDVIGVPEGVANRLLDSWPGSWQAIAPIFTIEEVIREAHELANAAVVEDAAMDAPPADKMMRKAKAKRRG